MPDYISERELNNCYNFKKREFVQHRLEREVDELRRGRW